MWQDVKNDHDSNHTALKFHTKTAKKKAGPLENASSASNMASFRVSMLLVLLRGTFHHGHDRLNYQ